MGASSELAAHTATRVKQTRSLGKVYVAAPNLYGLPAFLAFLLVCPLLIVSYVLYRVCSTRSRGYAPLEGIQHAEHDE